MYCYNKATLLGYVVHDPEIKTTKTNLEMCKFKIACNKQWKNKDGSLNKSVDYIPVVCFNKNAIIAATHALKGRKIFVYGEIKQSSWEKDGKMHSRIEIVADLISLIDKKTQEAQEAEEALEG